VTTKAGVHGWRLWQSLRRDDDGWALVPPFRTVRQAWSYSAHQVVRGCRLGVDHPVPDASCDCGAFACLTLAGLAAYMRYAYVVTPVTGHGPVYWATDDPPKWQAWRAGHIEMRALFISAVYAPVVDELGAQFGVPVVVAGEARVPEVRPDIRADMLRRFPWVFRPRAGPLIIPALLDDERAHAYGNIDRCDGPMPTGPTEPPVNRRWIGGRTLVDVDQAQGTVRQLDLDRWVR